MQGRDGPRPRGRGGRAWRLPEPRKEVVLQLHARYKGLIWLQRRAATEGWRNERTDRLAFW